MIGRLASVLTSLMFVLSWANVQGQSHHPLLRPDANWDLAYYESSTICGWVAAWNYFIAADTVINGLPYARFGVRSIADIDGPPFCPPGYYVTSGAGITDLCLREDTVAGLVFQFDHTLQTERVLYDLNLEVGDTIDDYFDFDQLGWPPTPTIVLTLDSVQLNDGEYHRRWGLSTTIWGEILHDYIEGVGSTFGITHVVPQYYGDGSHLWCYKRNEVDVLWSVHYCPIPGFLGVEGNTPSLGDERPTLSTTLDGRAMLIADGPLEVGIHTMDGRLVFRRLLSPGLPETMRSVPWGAYMYTLHRSGARVGSGRIFLHE